MALSAFSVVPQYVAYLTNAKGDRLEHIMLRRDNDGRRRLIRIRANFQPLDVFINDQKVVFKSQYLGWWAIRAEMPPDFTTSNLPSGFYGVKVVLIGPLRREITFEAVLGFVARNSKAGRHAWGS